MRDRLVKADAAGLQLCLHAIGDRGIAMVLDLFQDVIAANGPRDRRFRVEHAQHMAPRRLRAFREAGRDRLRAAVPRHRRRALGGQADRPRAEPHDLRLPQLPRSPGCGSPWGPIGTWLPLNPMETLYAAVTRATLDGKRPGGWVPEEKITLAEAVDAYTLGSADAEFQDGEKGSLTPGKLADFVVLSDDIFAIPPEALRKVQVVKTVVGGKVVFSRD